MGQAPSPAIGLRTAQPQSGALAELLPEMQLEVPSEILPEVPAELLLPEVLSELLPEVMQY
jgi:hypothetical protein